MSGKWQRKWLQFWEGRTSSNNAKNTRPDLILGQIMASCKRNTEYSTHLYRKQGKCTGSSYWEDVQKGKGHGNVERGTGHICQRKASYFLMFFRVFKFCHEMCNAYIYEDVIRSIKAYILEQH